MKVVKSLEGEWMFDAGPHLVSYSCHHKKKGACGGCYARAILALRNIEKSTGDVVAGAFSAALREEGAARKKAKRG